MGDEPFWSINDRGLAYQYTAYINIYILLYPSLLL